MTSTSTCHLCGTITTEIAGFSALVRVTSDARPWPAGGRLVLCPACGLVQKPITPEWQAEAAEIYSGYWLYPQANGTEQAVFNAGMPRRRSDQLLDGVLGAASLPRTGRAVDIGCGNGAMLQALSGRLPGWRLLGCELNDRNRQVVEAIPGVERLHVGDIHSLPDGFDLATLLHSLEHFPDPVGTLALIAKHLAAQGTLVIEVPDHGRNPFDLVIADHCSHFTAHSLDQTLRAAGFVPSLVTGQWVAKELSALARPGGLRETEISPDSGAAARVARSVAWLEDLASQALAEAARGPVAIFGSSIGGSWLVGLLGDKATMLVDEDPARIGQSHLGLPIVAPSQVPAKTPVLVPLSPEIAPALAARLCPPGGRWLAPPPLDG
jgi:SAM-dependent methyltransferase